MTGRRLLLHLGDLIGKIQAAVHSTQVMAVIRWVRSNEQFLRDMNRHDYLWQLGDVVDYLRIVYWVRLSLLLA
jgi:hypothetical protein